MNLSGGRSKKARGLRSNINADINKSLVGGIAENKAETFIPVSQALTILNMHQTEEGTWTAHQIGYSHLNSSAEESGASIDGLHWFTDSSSVDHLLLAVNGKLKEINTSNGTVTSQDASAGYEVGGQVDFQTFNNTVYAVDGVMASPRKWNGSTGSNASGWPVDSKYNKPRFIEEHQNRLAFADFNDSTGGTANYHSHIILSDLDNGESFTATPSTAAHAYIAEVGPGDGQRLRGMRSMHIPNSNDSVLVLFKDRSTYLLTGASPLSADADVFTIIRINGNYGALNNKCIVQVGNDILALNEYGVTSYTALTSDGSIQPSAIQSDLVKDTLATLNLTYKHKAWGLHIPNRREILWGFPAGSSSQVDTVLVFKYPDPGDPTATAKWSIRTGMAPSCAAMVNRDVFIGLYTGYVAKMFNSNAYHETGISWRYEFPPDPLGNEKQIKSVVDMDILVKLRSATTMSVVTEWIGGGNNNRTDRSAAISPRTSGSVYGTGTYGTAIYGSADETKKNVTVQGNGERLKVTLSGTTTTSGGPELIGLRSVVEYGAMSRAYN